MEITALTGFGPGGHELPFPREGWYPRSPFADCLVIDLPPKPSLGCVSLGIAFTFYRRCSFVVVDTSNNLKRIDLKQPGELDHGLASGMEHAMIPIRQVIIGHAELVAELMVSPKLVSLLGVV